MSGGAGNDTLYGGADSDYLDGGSGVDNMVGGAGDEIYYVDNSADIVTEAAGEGLDWVVATASFTLSDNVDHMAFTGTAAVSGTGNGLANSLVGNDGANTLKGEGGNDAISGGVGNDFLYGGTGNDDLMGGAGSDSFYFDTALSGSLNVDQIMDFSSADDSIYLQTSVFTGINGGGALSAASFRLGSVAADGDDRIIYDEASGKLYYDADGNGAVAAIQFAQLTPGTAVNAADFFLYG